MIIHNAMISIATTQPFNLAKVLDESDVANATVNRALRSGFGAWAQILICMQLTGTAGVLSIGNNSTVGDNDNICQLSSPDASFTFPKDTGKMSVGDVWLAGPIGMKVAVTLFFS